MKILSFSYKKGEPPLGPGWVVLDCLLIANPYGDRRLRALDGRHKDVQAFVMADAKALVLLAQAEGAAREGNNVAFGCLGGRHRSVSLAETLVRNMAAVGVCATVEHSCL
jgi:UPF0042 nucleotide-binding protein